MIPHPIAAPVDGKPIQREDCKIASILARIGDKW
ncbi:MAG: hypothetical protein JWQ46_2076, partial [Phenylobacterium sp.]|nr:hypothetical protein [Phenylobacterium sp.]